MKLKINNRLYFSKIDKILFTLYYIHSKIIFKFNILQINFKAIIVLAEVCYKSKLWIWINNWNEIKLQTLLTPKKGRVLKNGYFGELDNGIESEKRLPFYCLQICPYEI
jgi:hypothetical protein